MTKSYDAHELLDRTHMIAEMFERFVVEHPAMGVDPDVRQRIEHVAEQLHDLYQAIGRAEI